jgi:hypothetical protein
MLLTEGVAGDGQLAVVKLVLVQDEYKEPQLLLT